MRRLYSGVALCAIAILVIPASAWALQPEQLSPASQSLARCVQTNGRLSVLMLIDESGSLVTTDPFNQRVDGIRAALTGLADLSDTPVDGQRPEVSVLMAGFFGRVHPNPEEGIPENAWKQVSHDDVDRLLGEAGGYQSLNHGRATDYVTALVAARKLLAARAAEQTESGGAAPCEGLIWFTDGRYALPRRVGKAGVGLPLTLPYAPGIHLDQKGAGEKAVAAGKRFMCRPNGLMDRLQQDGVIRFTVALSTDLSKSDGAFLDAATTGAAGRQHCGAHLSHLSGEYLTARNGDRLFFAFAGLLGSIPPVHERPICPQELSCVRGMTTFQTVPGLSRFLIRASGGVERGGGQASRPLQLRLEAPGGRSVTLEPGGPAELTSAGVKIVQRWVSDRAVEVQGDFAAGNHAWLGRWSYAFVDPAASPREPATPGYSAVQLFADLEPAVDGSAVLIRGSPTKLHFNLVQGSDPDSAVTTGPLLRSARLIASIDDPVAGTSTRVPVRGPNADGTFSATVTIPPASTAGFVYLGLTAAFSTASGTPIAPQYRSFRASVRFPPGQGFPTISPATLELPTLRGTGQVEAQFTVKGSSVSPGCVWIGAPKVQAPSAAGKVKSEISPPAGSAGDCIRLGKGEERQFTVRFAPDSEASGTVTASLPVHLGSDLVKGDRVVTLPATFVMGRAPNTVTLVVLLVGLILLGALLPLLLLHLLNRQGARFIAPNRLRVVELPVEMERGGRLRRSGEGGDPRTGLDRGESLASHGDRPVRDLDLGDLHLEAVASGSLKDRTFVLFRGPYGVARAGGRRLLAGFKQPLRSWQDGTAQEVSLGLAGTWIFRLDALRPADAQETWSAFDQPPVPVQPESGERFLLAPTQPEGASGPPVPQPREAKIEGRLVLLITDGPPVDQAEALFDAAEQGLRDAEDLWEEARPEPEPGGPDGDGPPSAEPAASTEPMVSGEPEPARARAPERQTTDWTPSSTPAQRRKRSSDKRTGW